MPNPEFIKGVKISSYLMYIPFVIAVMPLAGYLTGDYLEKKFHVSHYVTIGLVAVGVITALMETVKIIKIVIKIEEKKETADQRPKTKD